MYAQDTTTFVSEMATNQKPPSKQIKDCSNHGSCRLDSKNAPSVFQRMVNTQFTDILAKGDVINYMDDFLIATEDNITRHRERVNEVLERLQELDLYLKPSKCIFEVRCIEFLGVILENGTVMMDPIKVAGVADWKTPKNVKDIRKFLGFCNFYQCFIRGFSQIAKALND